MVTAINLREGDTLETMEGTACITNIVKERHEEPVTVYNLAVKDWVSYFVEKVKVYIHNGAYIGGKVSLPETSYTTPKLQHEYKHASDFKINGSCNKSKIKEYQQAIQNHINNASDIYISKYKGMDVYVYYDKKTGLGSYVDLNGNYLNDK